METLNVDHINHADIRNFVHKYVNNNGHAGDKVSDDNFLKFTVYEDNADYKKSIIVTSAAASNLNQQNCYGIQKLEIYRDRFGNGHKMVFSQKVDVLFFFLLCFHFEFTATLTKK